MLGFPFIFHRENWIKSGSTSYVNAVERHQLEFYPCRRLLRLSNIGHLQRKKKYTDNE
jgi:hypothetical protein